MQVVVDKYIIDSNNDICFSANGFESATGEVAHKIMFRVLEVYRQIKSTNKPSQNYFICTLLENMAKGNKWTKEENIYSYEF